MRIFIKHALFCAALVGTAWSAQANALPYQSVQIENSEKKELPNPEKAAKRMTDEMQKSLGLTDKQYKKVYKLNLKEEKARVEQMKARGADGNRPPMMGGAPGGGFPPMGGGPGGGGFPPMGGNGGPGMPPPSSSGKNDIRSLMEKKDKQMKKILTEEQYAKWHSEQPRPRRDQKCCPACQNKPDGEDK